MERTTPLAYDVAVQTTANKETIPAHIHKCWETYFKGTRVILDDAECKEFLSIHYGPVVADKFDYFEHGAHKADLFRYAWLYKQGGIYCDIKTILIRPLEEIFVDPATCYFVNTRTKHFPHIRHERIYNGIIATPPSNPLIYEMLQMVMSHSNSDPYINICKNSYSIIVRAMHTTPATFVGPLQPKCDTDTSTQIPRVYIFTEELDKHCNGKYDRRGFCNWVVDQDKTPLFYVRDVAYENDTTTWTEWIKHRSHLWNPMYYPSLLLQQLYYMLVSK